MNLLKYLLSAAVMTAAITLIVSEAGVNSPSEAATEPTAAGLPHAQPAAAFPNTDDGLPVMQLGVGGGFEAPFLNVIKDGSVNWNTPAGAGRMELDGLVAAGLIGPDWMPEGLPPGASSVQGMPFREGARVPALRPYYAGTWVIEWDGEADAAFGLVWASEVPQRKIGGNRLEGDFPAVMNGSSHSSVRFSNLGAAREGGLANDSGVSNLRVFRAGNEEALKAGKLLSPDFRAYASRYKVLRTLDLQAVNINWQRTADQFAPLDAPGWRASNFERVKKAPRGFPPEPMFQMAMETGTALWMHFPGQTGAGPAFDADDVFGNVDGALEKLAQEKAGEIIASPEWDRIAGRIADALIASGYPEDRRFYLELSNEVWNFAHPFWRTTNYYQGIGRGLFPDTGAVKGERFRLGYGYASARMAEAFEKALSQRGRKQAWVPVIAGQNAGPHRTAAALEGYKAYFAARGLGGEALAAWMKIAGVSTASYYERALSMKHGVVKAGAGETIEEAWLREVRADPDGLAARVADFYIDSPASVAGTLAWLAANRAANQKIAEDYGAFFLGDYEGGDHDLPNPPAALRAEPDYVNWVERYRYGPEGERVTRAWIEMLRAQNPQAIIANFYGVSAGDKEPDETDTTLESPWADGFYGDVNGRTRGLGEYLRKPK